MSLEELKKQEFTCTREQAQKLVLKSRREGAKWAVSIRLDARIIDKPGHYFPDGCAHWIDLSREQAKELIKGLLSDYMEQERGARIYITRSQYGDSPATYWISQ